MFCFVDVCTVRSSPKLYIYLFIYLSIYLSIYIYYLSR